MKIYSDIYDIERPFNRPALTIGNFDGVHLGHQALFKKVVELADERNGDKVALTFHPHPMKVLRPDNPPKLICTLEQKIELIMAAGIEHLICLPFTKEFARTPASFFVEEILYRIIGVEDLVIGYDYKCGRGREGDIDFLKRMGDKLGFRVHVIPPVKVDGMIVSSTAIRELVKKGDMRMVRKMLGRFYQIRGVVRKGKRRGGPIVGFPTANLALNPEDLCPKPGVYAVQVIHGERLYDGVVNIGFNPTFGDGRLGAEVHIFDFNKEIYGHEIKVNLVERIRDEKKFSGPEELAAQIKKDIQKAKEILKEIRS
ncbi:MAG: bifunctional riboflavin kinase/FAD synthetase [Thermodesulfobacteria bacterium]|nr:bifunctional riboflavin kinase/FAD synthetase [Thermodesulfobacteriota bacterium]